MAQVDCQINTRKITVICENIKIIIRINHLNIVKQVDKKIEEEYSEYIYCLVVNQQVSERLDWTATYSRMRTLGKYGEGVW